MPVLVASLLAGCITDADFSLPEEGTQFIIEGKIETDQPVRVLISRSQPYFSIAGNTDLVDLVETRASVTLDDGFTSESLLLVMDTFYTRLPVYKSYGIKGVPGRIYSLTVSVEGKTFTATDTLGLAVRPDTVWFEADTALSDAGYLHMTLKDPADRGNNYRFLYKRLGKDEDFRLLTIGVLQDAFANGQTWQLPLARGGTNVLFPTDPYFRVGETVVIQVQSMSARVARTWIALQHEAAFTINPLNSQQALPTNFSGGALGVFGAYAVHNDTIHIIN